MKISQLVLREDFYHILENTLSKNSFFEYSQENEKYVVYKSFQYLNIIFGKELSNTCKKALVYEYRLSQSKLKMLVQKSYIFFVFLPIINNFFVHKRLVLPINISKYAIVGGNHRIRLFDNYLKEINVLLKDNENIKFIKNDIKTRTNYNIEYAPTILSFGDDWLVEEYISGVPFNRIVNEQLLTNAFEVIVQKHLKELVIKSKRTISIEVYLQDNLNEINSLLSLLDNNKLLQVELENTTKAIFDKIKDENIKSIDIATTHGDFQKGNMRITSNNDIIVLDWEAADRRFYIYDLYVLFSGKREGKELKYGLSLFFDTINKYDDILTKYSKKAISALLCLEELKFNLYEDISLNYFQPGIKSKLISSSIDELLLSFK